jgi:uncharacterized linocin/CFP29 family protein
MDFLLRDDAPLSSEQWAALDGLVVDTARKYLVGRRFLKMVGPLGAGMPVVPLADMSCDPDTEVFASGETQLLPLEELSQDFMLNWRSLEIANRMGAPLDFSPAGLAARAVAEAEDRLIFGGCEHCEAQGLLQVPGSQSLTSSNWNTAGNILGDLVKGVEALAEAAFPGPYAMILPPGAHALANRTLGQGQRLEIELLKQVATAGVFASPAIPAGQALVLETGSHNLDLAVGLDMKVAYMGNEDLDHLFRVVETLALRVKCPEAIAVFKKGSSKK